MNPHELKKLLDLCQDANEAMLAANRLSVAASNLRQALRAASQAIADGSDAKHETRALTRAVENFSQAYLALGGPASHLLSEHTPGDSPLEEIAILSRQTASTTLGERIMLAVNDLLACPDAMGSIEFISTDIPKEPVLCVPTKSGTLRAGYYGDPHIYDGIAIDIVRPDGKLTQCAVVECTDKGRVHTLAWNGDSETATCEETVDLNGDYWYD